METINYEVEYSARGRVPEHPQIMAGWRRDAAVYREKHPPELVSYGTGERNVMDIFHAEQGGTSALFVHGGYWQAKALDKDSFSHLAGGLMLMEFLSQL